MAELFDCSSDNIGLHLKNIYAEGELQESATAEKISVVQLEGSRKVNREPMFYNLALTTRQFFKKVQNKMHYAVHGHTAAELGGLGKTHRLNPRSQW